MSKIGFDWGWGGWGKSAKKSSVSKWEKSFYGGFYRLVSDHPRVVIDYNMDFKFATMKYLAYFEKEKICKIFLSKVKNNDLIEDLMHGAVTVTEKNMLGDNMLITTISRNSKDTVLEILMGISDEKEYCPFFEHYSDFILDSDFYFKKPEGGNGGGNGEGGSDSKNDEKKNNEQNGKQENKKNQQNQNGDEQDGQDSQDQDKEQNKNQQDQGTGDQNLSSTESDEKNQQEKYKQNVAEFIKALQDLREEEIKYDFISTYNKKPNTIILSEYRETEFTQSEKDIADRLTNMLDISFDPTSDTVKNLRLGKLDISKIAEVPAGNVAIYKQTVENQTTKPFSVVILCDESGSMTDRARSDDGITTKLIKQYQTIKSLYLSFSDILPAEKLFIYGHSGTYSPELYVYHDQYNQKFLKTIDLMCTNHHKSLNYNYDGPIIEEVHKSVRAVTDDRIIFIVLSDGLPNGNDGSYGWRIPTDIVNMKQIIEKCKRDDFVTVGIGILEHRVKGLYQYGTIINELSEMPKKVSHIINHVVKTEFQ